MASKLPVSKPRRTDGGAGGLRPGASNAGARPVLVPAFVLLGFAAATAVGTGVALKVQRTAATEHGERADDRLEHVAAIKTERWLVGRWKVDTQSAAARESMRRSATAIKTAATEAGLVGNYDVEPFVDNLLRTLAALDVEFTPDAIVVSNGADTKTIAYDVVPRPDGSVILETHGSNPLSPSSKVLARRVDSETLLVGSENGDSPLLLRRRATGS